MPIETVLKLHEAMTSHDVHVWIDGGWGVDALLGRQTRRHRDLDIALQKRDEPMLRELLGALGYREKGEWYAKPWNYILTDDEGHELDLHILELDSDGNGVYGGDSGESYTAHALSGRGTIADRDVLCVAASDLIGFHRGYELRDKDFRDVSALCEAFGIPLPDEYHRFLTDEPSN